MSAFTDVTRSWTWCKQLHEGGNMEYLRKLFVRIEIPSLRRLNERRKKSTAFTILAILVSVAGPVFANTEGRPIDNAHSTMTVYVYKTGILSGLAHNHEIEAPIESGEVNNSERPSVELRVNSGKLRVLDPEVSDGTRAKIKATMQSSEVLDVGQFPEIHFQSTGVEAGTDHWVVHGNLDLHGQTHPISFEVALKDGLYQGAAVLKQSGFGITPVKIAGGTVKVEDEIKVVFSIALQR
jgi:polyisoprenoid-binding protein YceI